MKVLLEIKDEKALPLLEVLKGLSYLKMETLSEPRAKALQEFKEAIKQVNLDKQGKIKLKSIHTLLNEI